MRLWEGLSAELNFNLMLSQRGVLNLAHSEADIREGIRRVGANRLQGIDAEWLDPAAVKHFCPILNISTPTLRRPATRCWERRCSGVAAWRATTRSPGALPAPPTRAASTSSRIAR